MRFLNGEVRHAQGSESGCRAQEEGLQNRRGLHVLTAETSSSPSHGAGVVRHRWSTMKNFLCAAIDRYRTRVQCTTIGMSYQRSEFSHLRSVHRAGWCYAIVQRPHCMMRRHIIIQAIHSFALLSIISVSTSARTAGRLRYSLRGSVAWPRASLPLRRPSLCVAWRNTDEI